MAPGGGAEKRRDERRGGDDAVRASAQLRPAPARFFIRLRPRRLDRARRAQMAVERRPAHPSTSAIFAVVCSRESCIDRATASFSALMTVGRPPRRPRVRAAERPACVRSRIRSRSNSASAAKTWKTSRPPGVVVSFDSVSERSRSRAFERGNRLDEVAQRAAEAIEAPYHQRLASACILERARAPAGQRALRSPGAEDPLASCGLEGVLLERRLLGEGRDAGVANEHHRTAVSEPSDGGRRETLIAGTGCERPADAKPRGEQRVSETTVCEIAEASV